jgi:UPF0755 protein
MAKKKSSAKNLKKKGSSKFKKIFVASLIIFLMSGIGLIYFYYKSVYQRNINLKNTEPYIYIKTGSNFEDVKKLLEGKNILLNTASFEWLAKQKNYTNRVKPGKYKLENGMTNNELLNKLRAGDQESVNLTINNIRTKYELISKVCTVLETDSNELKNILENDHQLEKLKLNSDNIISIFIPNTYQFYWNTSAKDFFDRMLNESDKFWSRSRIEKLHKLKLSKAEVITIASIVEKESNYLPERPSIASVYLNRVRKGMKLQADPTVVYAVGDFKINRVLDVHLKKDSPYNTYMYEGLPPGPICIPSANAIDAVLKNEKTSYIYFCAKEDFSGRHNFATTDAQHSINANKFRKALNKRKIYK